MILQRIRYVIVDIDRIFSHILFKEKIGKPLFEKTKIQYN